MTPRTLFLLQGNGPLLNRGCEAILRSTVSLLRDEFGPCRFINSPSSRIHPKRYDEVDRDITHFLPYKKWSVLGFTSRVMRRFFGRSGKHFERCIPRAAATLVLGGDNLSLDYGNPSGLFLQNRLTLKHGKPLILWGASIGPFAKDPQFERFAAEELKKTSLICARESETISYLATIGVTENVRSVSDPAFVLEPQVVHNDPELSILDEPCIGLSLSSLFDRYWNREPSLLDASTEWISSVVRKNDLPVLLIPHVVYPQRNDHAFMKQIVDKLGGLKSRVKLLGPQYNAQQLKWIISQVTVFAGARTHSTIAALSSHVPTISIGYSMKARGLNEDIFGHCDWLISLNDLCGDLLAGRIGQLLAGTPQVRKHLTEIMPAYKAKARQAAKYVREVIDAGM